GPFVLTTATTTPCAIGVAIAAGTTCRIGVAYAASSAAVETGTLTVTDSAPLGPRTSSLTGTGLPNPAITPGSVIFSTQAVGARPFAKTFVYQNLSPVSVTLRTIGLNTAQFVLLHPLNECLPNAVIAPGATCNMVVSFQPQLDGTFG